MSPQCDLDIEVSKTIISQVTLAHNGASAYQVRLQKYSVVQKISPEQTFIDNFNLHRDLDLEHSY